MLNVDNEVVEINATHLSFSGVGRQKPKTYVVNLEFFEPIDAENSSWSFGSVGTVKFVLQKAAAREWPRLTAGKESVKNHRVWWEKQEQVREADRKAKAAREAKENARREEERKKEEVERAVKAAEEKREAAAKEYEERSAKRAEQLPFLQPALDAVDDLVSSLDQGDEAVEAALGAGKEATKALLDAVGQGDNATAVSTATQLLSTVKSLGSTGYKELTKDALESTVREYKRMCEGFVEPEPEEPPPPPPPKGEGGAKAAGGTKKKKKGKGKKKKEEEAAAAE